MSRFIILFLFIVSNLFAIQNLQPTFVYTASGGVTDMVGSNNKLYVATQASAVDIFDIKTHKLIKKIKVPQITDFMGDEVDAKIYSVDIYKNKLIFTVQATSGFRELYIYEKNKLKKLISEEDKLYIAKARFVDDEHIVFCLLGNSMYLYNYKTNKTEWTLEIRAPEAEFNSTFSDFVLNEKRDMAVVADEGGDLKVVDLKNKKIVKVLAGKNLDKVFKVDFKNNIIITAGQDGRAVVYDLSKNKNYTLREKNWFLIYTAGLSPSGSRGAFSIDQENNIVVFDIKTEQKLYLLKHNLMNPTVILFLDDNNVFVATDSNKFNYYKLK